MTEPLPSTPSSSEPLSYQPISGWAITGFATGCLYTLMVVISAGFAFYDGGPFFFPIWTMGIALAGMALSRYGLRQIQTSEGTLAGGALARWGFRLSLVSGLIYFSYYTVTRIAVESQANAFVMGEIGDDTGFMKRVLQGSENRAQLNAAFLLTRPPNSRSARADNEESMRSNYDRPTEKDYFSGDLTQFREGSAPSGGTVHGILPRILYKQRPEDVEITPLSVIDSRYEKRSYRIYRAYRIKTKELQTDYLLAVYSMEAEGGQGRKWFVNLKESGTLEKATRLTPFGEGLVRLRMRGKEWLERRFKGLDEGVPFSAESIKKMDRTPWDVLAIVDGNRDELRIQMHKFLAGDRDLRFQAQRFDVLTQAEHPGKWEFVDDKIRIHLMFHFVLEKGYRQFPFYHFDALATLESTQAIDPTRFDRVDWNLVGLEFTAVTVLREAPKSDLPEPKR